MFGSFHESTSLSSKRNDGRDFDFLPILFKYVADMYYDGRERLEGEKQRNIIIGFSMPCLVHGMGIEE